MSKNKLNLKEKVLTCGAGARRAVLDYESGLAYQYDDPSNVLAYYQSSKGWIVRDQPYYSSGGWGSGSSGDGEGHYLVAHTREMLQAIDATIYEVNSLEFLTKNEVETLQKAVKKHNKLVESQNRIAKKLGEKRVTIKELEPLPTFKLRNLRKGKNGPKGKDVIETALNYKTALNVFIEQKGKALKVDEYLIQRDLVKQGEQVVAFRDSQGQVFLNSQVLQVSTFEREFLGNQSMIQKQLREVAKYSIPFNVLASANLKLSETKVLEQGPESTHIIKDPQGWGADVERHFTGALLLENAGRKFLMDIDRLEIQNRIFNAFFVEVSKDVKTIAEAYESMKPQVIKDAEAKGLKVKRQGEWFFVDTGKTLTVSEDDVLDWDRSQAKKNIVLRHQIAHGKGRPNNLYKPVGFGELDSLVCGTVSHSGREHGDLDLGQNKSTIQNPETKETQTRITFNLWEVVPNSTVGNFTISGDID